jgi:hypothetical protein
MKLVAYPAILDGVLFLQPVDNALADITEGSDIVGKYFNVNCHFIFHNNYLERTELNILAIF